MTHTSIIFNAQEAVSGFRMIFETPDGRRTYRLIIDTNSTVSIVANSPTELLDLADLLSVAAEQWTDQS